MKIAYLVSRFPAISETFVLRELEAVSGYSDIEADLFSLFPSRDSTIHPAARKWVDGLSRPGMAESAAGLAWWLLRRPVRLLSSFGIVIVSSATRPRIMLRSVVALAIASAHARTVQRREIEHVHAHFATYPALAAWLCMRLTDASYSFTAHAHDIFVHQVMLERKVADARFVVAISEYNREFLRRFDSAETPLAVVHCGIELARYPFRPRRVPRSGQVRLLCVGALRESKGHAVLLQAMAASKESLANIVLDLAGDGPLRMELTALAENLGLAERIRFLGNQTEEEVQGLLEEADLFVLPSTIASNGDMEGIPVALMEALASGLVTIATRMSGIPELIRDRETGLLAAPGDPSSLASVLRLALSEELGIDQGGARSLVEEEFDVARSAREMHALLIGRS